MHHAYFPGCRLLWVCTQRPRLSLLFENAQKDCVKKDSSVPTRHLKLPAALRRAAGKERSAIQINQVRAFLRSRICFTCVIGVVRVPDRHLARAATQQRSHEKKANK